LPAPLRALVWLIALPLGWVAAAVPLRAIGWLSVDDALDAFAGSGLGRWVILLVLLPLWAAISASLAHLAIEALTRRRASPRS
jgi:fumarate reductase subunit D